MSSAIREQAASDNAGRLLNFNEFPEPGDLLFSKGSPGGSLVTHVSVFIDPGHRIDETGEMCDIRSWGPSSGWPYNSLHSVRRPLDLIDEKMLGIPSVVGRNLSVYPVPALSYVKVEGLKHNDKIQVISMNGMPVTPLIKIGSENVNKIDISYLAPGYYIIKVFGNDKSIVSMPFLK